MNNGHPSQTNGADAQPFFTTGAGMPIENETPVEKNDNLDYSNKSAQWTNNIERNPRNIGSSAVNSRAVYNSSESLRDNPEMGKIIEIDMPPARGEPVTDKESDFLIGANLNAPADLISISDYSEKGKKISKETLKSVEHKVSEYKRGKISPAELDNSEWEGTKAYIENSFQRKIAA